MKANEVSAAFMSNEEAYKDKELFVHNLGELLQQTREDIVACELSLNDYVIVTYKGGLQTWVNINCDSYLAIIYDVIKCMI